VGLILYVKSTRFYVGVCATYKKKPATYKLVISKQ
jgi:hypothetical protein